MKFIIFQNERIQRKEIVAITAYKDSFNWLKVNPIDISGIRPYQKEAIESIEVAILAHKTKMILAMATGTGKTFTAAKLIYRLLKSQTAKRILFLVDRRVLAALC